MAVPVNVIDSIMITEERNTSTVLAEWSTLDPGILVYNELTSAYAVKLFLNWSDQNGTTDLQTGDYFTFVIPEIFRQDNIKNITDAAIKTPLGEVVATYSIYDNSDNIKEVKITFTDYVETHTDISGNFWLLLFIGRVDSTEEKIIKFVINGDLAASGEVKINPEPPYNRDPKNEKFGKSVLVDIYNGYYVFNWTVRFNMEEDAVNGFHTLENFSFEDVIPEESPHVFLTNEIRQELGFLPNKFPLRVGEYTQADSYFPEDRYPFFRHQYNGTGENLWFLDYEYLVDGYTTVGIDGDTGLNVSNVMLTEKSLSANLGRLTRPTGIQYCTIATVKISESALGDSEVVKLFENTFKVSHGEDLSQSLEIHRFGSGGEGQGIIGDYSFTFIKVDEKGDVLPGALFSLYLTEDFERADRFVYSGDDGVVKFLSLPLGTYYLKETIAPNGYVPNNTVYKVIINSEGFEIYYGDNFENKLSDHDNKITNRLEHEVLPVSVTFEGTKILTGKTLESDMFNFVVKDKDGKTVATGTNAANGNIIFSEIEFGSSGMYTFTVEEVRGSYSGISYDNSQYTVTVTVTDDGSGKLIAETTYPNEGVIFNNSYAVESVSVTFEGTKILTGKTLESDMFNFIVKDKDGKTVATGINSANGNIIFSEIEFGLSGMYTFTVEEVRGSYSGITYDNSQYTVIVTVTDDGSGKLIAETTYPNEGIVFNNSYAVESVSVTFEGTKILTGKTLESDMFNFVVKDKDGKTVATGINSANGNIIFSEIEFGSLGMYIFTVEEVRGSYSTITYDNSQYTVIVTVTDDGSGKLIAETTYPNEGVVFNNSYAKKPVKPCRCYAKSTKCRKSIKGQKIWLDNNNANDTRPDNIEILLLRDGEVYKRVIVDSENDWTYGFCCIPVYKNIGNKFVYSIDEAEVPGYTKTIEGYNVINTYTP